MTNSPTNYKIARVLRSKEDAIISYDRLSNWYDWLAGTSEWQFTQAGMEMLNVQPGESVLEVGYGTGKALKALALDVGPEGYVAGIDISTGMMAVARKRLQDEGLQDVVDLHCGDALDLPFASDLFDAVFISFTLELFDTPEIPVLLTACKNIMHDNGRLVIVAMAKRKHENLMQCLYNWAHISIPNYADCRPIYTIESVLQAGYRVKTILNKTMWGLPVEVVLAYIPV
ncbi:MAG: methyltransferase domain-containing protein [Chloroflexota bacterium]